MYLDLVPVMDQEASYRSGLVVRRRPPNAVDNTQVTLVEIRLQSCVCRTPLSVSLIPKEEADKEPCHGTLQVFASCCGVRNAVSKGQHLSAGGAPVSSLNCRCRA